MALHAVEGNPMKYRAFASSVALAFVLFVAAASLAQNAPASGANPKMTPKLAEMLMMGEVGPGSVGNRSMGVGSMDTNGRIL